MDACTLGLVFTQLESAAGWQEQVSGHIFCWSECSPSCCQPRWREHMQMFSLGLGALPSVAMRTKLP